MTAVPPDLLLAVSIQQHLDGALRQWHALPAAVEAWPAWDEPARLLYLLDWFQGEDRLRRLDEWAAEGRFTPAQAACYADLLEIVALLRPTLARLLAS